MSSGESAPRIVPALPAHMPEIVAIYNAAMEERIATSDTEAQTLEDRQASFERLRDRYPFLVAVDGEEVVGYANLYPWSPRAGYRFTAENAVYVRRDRRGTGLGRRLLGALVEAARVAGFRHLVARVFEHNSASQALHVSFGYRKIGVQREVTCMDGRWYDVGLFERILR